MGKNHFNKYFLQAISAVVFFVVFRQAATAQAPAFSTLQESFQNYREQVLQEKVFVHTDKEFYLAGETVWFKIYYVDASFHRALDISKVAYIEVLNKTQTPVLQTKVALQKGGGTGSVVLPNDIGSGYYSLRAYTAWMKNFDAGFYFEKKLTVVNTLTDANANTAAENPSRYDIQFFPEGGNLVSGFKTKLAFRAVDESGKGIALTGAIVNENNDTVNLFRPLLFGMGSFDFTPEKNHLYKAIVSLPNNEKRVLELPKVYEQGYVLNARENGTGKIVVSVQTNMAEGAEVHLFVHARNQVQVAAPGIVKNGFSEFAIDKEKLGEGISHFTLFDSRMQPVCERLFFKRPKALQIQVTTDHQEYTRRQKVVLDIEAKDEKEKLHAANLSLAVYHIDSMPVTDDGDIVSYLFLQSDIKGNIESPGYYFANETAETDAALDNLMLTHGWRRFKWDDILQNKNIAFRFLPEWEGHIVSARLVNTATNTPANNIPAFLSIPGPDFQLYTAQSNAEGKVNFYGKSFFGPSEVVVQANPYDKNSVFRVDVETPFSENFSSNRLPAFKTVAFTTGGLQAKSINMQVQKIYNLGKALVSVPVKKDTVAFYGNAEISYALDDYVRFPTMEEVLREYVREINVYRNNKSFSLALIKRDVSGLAEKRAPLVLIDGIPVLDDMNKVFRYDPLKVRELEIVNKDYYLGTNVFEGVVNFKTYSGRPEGLELDTKATVLDYEGLQLKREFYAPVYETENERQSRLPDFRSLLHWSPGIKTDNNGKQTIIFYTSDLTGQYIGVIQGLTADGKAGSKLFKINVKQ